MWFCDWLQGWMPFKTAREVHGGYVRIIGPHGEIEATTVRRLVIVGSHADSMQVRSKGDGLEFSGSPAKFMLGHNLYGSNAVETFGCGLAAVFAEKLGLELTEADVVRLLLGDVPLTRIDLTRMYRPEWARPGWVPKWLAIAGTFIHAGRQKVIPASAYDGGTLYVGKGSRRIQTKLYDKERELRKHPPRIIGEGAEEHLAELHAYAADTLRLEVQLRTLELKDRGLDRLSAWTPEIGDAILDERIARLGIPEDLRMTDDEMEFLPRKLREVYRLWRAGDDLRQIYSKPTFYRHRKALLAHGIDIGHTQPHEVITKREYALGRPLKDYLAGGGLEPPASAYERGELEVG